MVIGVQNGSRAVQSAATWDTAIEPVDTATMPGTVNPVCSWTRRMASPERRAGGRMIGNWWISATSRTFPKQSFSRVRSASPNRQGERQRSVGREDRRSCQSHRPVQMGGNAAAFSSAHASTSHANPRAAWARLCTCRGRRGLRLQPSSRTEKGIDWRRVHAAGESRDQPFLDFDLCTCTHDSDSPDPPREPTEAAGDLDAVVLHAILCPLSAGRWSWLSMDQGATRGHRVPGLTGSQSFRKAVGRDSRWSPRWSGSYRRP